MYHLDNETSSKLDEFGRAVLYFPGPGRYLNNQNYLELLQNKRIILRRPMPLRFNVKTTALLLFL